MPQFNYENPKNVDGSGIGTPEDRLFQTVLELLVYEGYRAVTEEALAERGISPALAAAYGSPEELCGAAVQDAAERITIACESAAEDARLYLASKKYTKDFSYMHLERLLYRYIYLCFHPKNRVYVLACAQESQLLPEWKELLTDVMQREFADVLTELILAAGEMKNRQMAAVMACAVCGCVTAFVQQPGFCKKVFREATGEDPNYAVAEDFLNNMLLRMIEANTGINKPF